MIYEFKMYKTQVEDHVFWVAESKVLNGCSAQGDTAQEAYSNLEATEQEWLETAKEMEWKIPDVPIRDLKVYSGKVALRLSPMVHKDAAEYADELGISLNQYISNALVSYNERAKYGDLNQIVPYEPIKETRSIKVEVNLHLEETQVVLINNLKEDHVNV